MINYRVRAREQLDPIFLPFFDALCEKLDAKWAPCSSRRTFAAQDALYAQGRTKPGKIVTNAKGGQSAHNYGMATDWCLWEKGEPHWPDAGDPCWLDFKAAVESVGLRWGGEWGDFDHCELKIAIPWSTIATVFFDKGPEAANAAIKTALLGPPGGGS